MTIPSKTQGSVLITGGSYGLGYETARAIATLQPDWTIIIAARTRADLDKAAATIYAEHPKTTVVPMTVDLASNASVHSLVRQITERKVLPLLRAIICNAGLQIITTKTSTDGYEMTFAVNHLGHYLLTRSLLDVLTTPARIIFLGSSTHDPAQKSGLPDPVYTSATALATPTTADKTNEDEVTLGRRRYATSKLLNILCMYEFSRQLQIAGRTGISVTAFDPGLMPGSGLAREYSPVVRFFWNNVMQAMIPLRPQWSSTRISGAALARLAVSTEYDGVTGKYFAIDRKRMTPFESSVDSHNSKYARDLWDTSARMVDLPAGLNGQ